MASLLGSTPGSWLRTDVKNSCCVWPCEHAFITLRQDAVLCCLAASAAYSWRRLSVGILCTRRLVLRRLGRPGLTVGRTGLAALLPAAAGTELVGAWAAACGLAAGLAGAAGVAALLAAGAGVVDSPGCCSMRDICRAAFSSSSMPSKSMSSSAAEAAAAGAGCAAGAAGGCCSCRGLLGIHLRPQTWAQPVAECASPSPPPNWRL